MSEASNLDQQLIAAADAGDVAAIEDLLRRGAAIDARDSQGRTAVMAATYGGHTAAVAALFAAGADVNIRDGILNNPFLYAGAEGMLPIARLAADAGADPNLTNRYGGIAIIPASERGHVEMVEYLLTETGVNVNHINRLGWTALLEAIILADGGPRHQRIVSLLLDHGADPSIADHDGVTPLEHAQSRGYTEIVRLLEAHGA